MSIFLSFFGIPGLKLSAVILTVLLSELMTKNSIHQKFTVYQDIAIFPRKSPDGLMTELLIEFMAELLTGLILTTF